MSERFLTSEDSVDVPDGLHSKRNCDGLKRSLTNFLSLTRLLLGSSPARLSIFDGLEKSSLASRGSNFFAWSCLLSELQSDISKTLYLSSCPTGDLIKEHTPKFVERLDTIYRKTPTRYHAYFDMNVLSTHLSDYASSILTSADIDISLMLLAVANTRLLLLRAIFNSGDISSQVRRCAVADGKRC